MTSVADAATATATSKEHQLPHDEKELGEKGTRDASNTSIHSSTRTSSTVHHPQTTAEGAEQDVEANTLARAPTGPLYSIFDKRTKLFIVVMAACGGFFSPLSANIYFPALNTLSQDLHVSQTLINLTLTSYMIFQGLAPTFVGDLADMTGRRPTYIVCFIIYMAANIGLATQNSYAALFVLRCLQSTGSSGLIALCIGVVADVATSAERGTYMGFATGGLMFAPAIGPVMGGILSQFLGWRAIFWGLLILAGVYFVPLVLFFPETGRNVVGNGSIPPKGLNVSLINYLQVRKHQKEQDALQRTSTRESQQQLAAKRKLRWPNPINTLKVVVEKDCGLILFYNSLIYVAYYDVMASTPALFAEIYGYNDLEIGLCFLPIGVGAFLAPMLVGYVMDWNFRRVAKQLGVTVDKKRGNDLKDFPVERVRIQLCYPCLAVGFAALLCYGWVLEVETSVAAPLVLQFIIGLTVTGAFNILSVMLVDFYPLSPSTATAANNLVRCLMGAAGTAIIIDMVNGMGRGWCFTFITLVCIVTSPLLWVVVKYGPTWREERRVRIEHAKEKKQKSSSANTERQQSATSDEVRAAEK